MWLPLYLAHELDRTLEQGQPATYPDRFAEDDTLVNGTFVNRSVE